MCSEKDPIDCHRMVLICRQLRSANIEIQHVLGDGSIETNSSSEMRLCERLGLQADLFTSRAETVEQAYDQQSIRIAYVVSRSPGAHGEAEL
jgi:hypothetical protein